MRMYRKRKTEARQEAIEWQHKMSNSSPSMECICRMQEHFAELGRKYGLLTEFRENGII